MPVDPGAFGRRLAQLRGERSIAEIARAAKVGRVTWSRWENGHQVPEPRTLAQLAEFLGVSELWLEHGEQAPGDVQRPLPGTDLCPIEEDERQLLQNYRTLGKHRQQAALESMRGLATAEAQERREARRAEKQAETAPPRRGQWRRSSS
jgi:transcriptional regulator with XRE-family HTH domain